jgi:thiol:disulfide interchange protein DsbA
MRNVFFKILIAGMALLVLGCNAQAQNEQEGAYQEGLHYFLIEGAPVVTPAPQELVEVFSYLCTHCNTFDPYAQSWLKDKPEGVEFSRIPAVFGRESWELYARGYVTAEMMKVSPDAHYALMARIWKEKNIIRNMDELAAFYTDFGLDPDKFLSTSRSFAVDGKLRKEQSLVRTWGITGTPSLVLNGKYRISGSAAVASYDDMFDVVNYLTGLETAASQPASATAD